MELILAVPPMVSPSRAPRRADRRQPEARAMELISVTPPIASPSRAPERADRRQPEARAMELISVTPPIASPSQAAARAACGETATRTPFAPPGRGLLSRRRATLCRALRVFPPPPERLSGARPPPLQAPGIREPHKVEQAGPINRRQRCGAGRWPRRDGARGASFRLRGASLRRSPVPRPAPQSRLRESRQSRKGRSDTAWGENGASENPPLTIAGQGNWTRAAGQPALLFGLY
jgi:hypothetical protein